MCNSVACVMCSLVEMGSLRFARSLRSRGSLRSPGGRKHFQSLNICNHSLGLLHMYIFDDFRGGGEGPLERGGGGCKKIDFLH